ncbi:MAG: hypothetical protein H0W46_05560, partial [Acidimicrobiia bacterium]|nr:hypothetical protein [Acidimicrobiia bacterium]
GGAVLGYGTRRGGRMREWLGTDGPGRPYIFDPVTGEDAISRIDDETLRAIAAELDVEYEHRQAPGSVATIVDGLDQGGRAASGDAVPVRTDRAWLLALLLVAVVLWELGAVTGDVVRATSIAGVGPASRRRSGVAAEGPRTSSVETVGDLSGGGS